MKNLFIGPKTPPTKEDHIKHAWQAGIFCGAITLIIVIISLVTGEALLGIDAYALIDVVLIFALTFGIYKKSRLCAIAMFIYFLISKVMMFVSNPNISGIILTLLLLYYFYNGIRGTFQYHKLKAKNEIEP